jgi:hypothetical protein
MNSSNLIGWKAFKLVPKAFRRVSKTKKSGKLRLKTYMAPVLEGKSIGSDPKSVLKSRAPNLEDQESG